MSKCGLTGCIGVCTVQVTGSSRQISPHNRTGTFNTTVDIKLKQWADSQLPIKSVEVSFILYSKVGADCRQILSNGKYYGQDFCRNPLCSILVDIFLNCLYFNCLTGLLIHCLAFGSVLNSLLAYSGLWIRIRMDPHSFFLLEGKFVN